MRAPSIEAVLAALATHSPADIAAAIYAANDIDVVETLITALVDASTRLATYPHDQVVYEADALLYDTLRAPVADAVPSGTIDIDPIDVARHRGITVAQASALLDRIRQSDADAARRLVDSPLDPNWTLPQQQVMTCIRELLAADLTPTRARVVAHATMRAREAMRPHEGTEPFAHPANPTLAPRILSPLAMTCVPAWMARMDAHPPCLDLARDRIAYLLAAKAAMARASRAHHHLQSVTAPPRPRPRPACTLA
ncbi:MAG: hypothetical protein Q8M17_08145 [Actinomycetota bacterium]|nr:hypothetical protein [Actinomycetota bacterium]